MCKNFQDFWTFCVLFKSFCTFWPISSYDKQLYKPCPSACCGNSFPVPAGGLPTTVLFVIT